MNSDGEWSLNYGWLINLSSEVYAPWNDIRFSKLSEVCISQNVALKMDSS